MDNDGAPGDESRVLEYELDVAAKTATQVWSYMANPSVYTFVLGEPIRLADGGTFVNWSTAGQMERLDPAGASVWKLNTERRLRVRVPDPRRPAFTAAADLAMNNQGGGT